MSDRANEVKFNNPHLIEILKNTGPRLHKECEGCDCQHKTKQVVSQEYKKLAGD